MKTLRVDDLHEHDADREVEQQAEERTGAGPHRAFGRDDALHLRPREAEVREQPLKSLFAIRIRPEP